jgi:uncharacterized protein (DUF1330 family)
MNDAPNFLILKFPRATERAWVDRWSHAIAAARGVVLAAATADAVTPLEAGSAHEALLLARFTVTGDLESFWADAPPPTSGLVALAAEGLPWEGWPGHAVPTIATVNVPDDGTPRTYMLIEGTGHDEQRLDRYRDIILPMLRERGAYYVLFSLGGSTRVLAGDWDEVVLAISRWPSRARAEEFWHCDRYQNEAIPLRQGVSRFDVQILEGLVG